jgi:hypothetical protein
MATRTINRGRSATAGGARSSGHGRGSGRTQAQAGRFGRSMSLSHASSSKRSKPSSSHRGLPLMSRKPAKKAGIAGLVGSVMSALPTGSSSKSKGSASKGGAAKKPAGVALFAAAAGMAFKNRDKIAGMMGRGSKRETEPMMPVNPQANTPPAI